MIKQNMSSDGAAGRAKNKNAAKGERFGVSFCNVSLFIKYAWKRFGDDRCAAMAASLSYTSLLAIVPLTAIAFSMLAAFPVFKGVREKFQTLIFSNFLPQSADAMRDYLDRFVQNTSGLTAVGIVGLALTAVLLLGAIESSLNNIFRVARPRAAVPRLLVFWALITLGPLLVGASFSLSTYFFALAEWAGADQFAGPLGAVTRLTPTLMVIAAMWIFYVIIPNRPVALRDAAAAAAISGVMFALLRQFFGFYIANFPTYQTIYGAVSAVPIFLVWMYLSWTVVLFGAELTAAFGEWRAAGGGRLVGSELRSGQRLTASLRILALLTAAHSKAEPVFRNKLLEKTEMAEQVLDQQLKCLAENNYVARTAAGAWIPARDFSEATLFQLLQDLGFDLRAPEPGHKDRLEPWEQRLARLTEANTASQRDTMGLSLKSLLCPEEKEQSVKS